MIFVTGDTHCPVDISKINSQNFYHDLNVSKEDYFIIAGDAGFVWDGAKTDAWWQKWIMKLPYTILFIDGNHENHELLNSYKIEKWNGGKIHRINDSLIHLMRGQVFNIDGTTFFTMGGAMSTDKEYRIEGISWWKEEEPSIKELKEGLINLDKHHWKVDYVLTHTAPLHVLKLINALYCMENLSDYLQIIDDKLTYKKWFFGHFHDDKNIDMKHRLIYYDVIAL